MNVLHELLDAVLFAAQRHRRQRRLGADASPYINHPIEVASMLARTANVMDIDILRAAVLHDTIEDTATTETELRLNFSDVVADYVVEVSDDKSLPKARRKALQIERAPHLSTGAALVKLADKTCNLLDLAISPPLEWSLMQRQEYFDWSMQVVERLPVVSSELLKAFKIAHAARPEST